MTILGIFSQAYCVFFWYVISNIFGFYFRKDSSIWSVPLLWVSSGTPIIHILDFLCLLSVFIHFSWLFFFSFLFEFKNFPPFLPSIFKGFTCIYLLLLFSNSDLYLKKIFLLPFIGNSFLSSVTSLLGFPNSDFCYFSLYYVIFWISFTSFWNGTLEFWFVFEHGFQVFFHCL